MKKARLSGLEIRALRTRKTALATGRSIRYNKYKPDGIPCRVTKAERRKAA